MKKQKTRIIVNLILILIICIFLLLIMKHKNDEFQDDIIFFKSFYLGNKKTNTNLEAEDKVNLNELLLINDNEKETNEKDSELPEYIFNVTYKDADFKDVNLTNTIDKTTLVNEKIAPGTAGAFEILLETNEKISYEIKFESKNEKPKNLVFSIKGKDRKYNNLEDMEKELKGEITENKSIVINWQWEYEKNETQNIQDTKDGEKLTKYNFTIFAIGK